MSWLELFFLYNHDLFSFEIFFFLCFNTRKFETSHVGGATGRTPCRSRSTLMHTPTRPHSCSAPSAGVNLCGACLVLLKYSVPAQSKSEKVSPRSQVPVRGRLRCLRSCGHRRSKPHPGVRQPLAWKSRAPALPSHPSSSSIISPAADAGTAGASTPASTLSQQHLYSQPPG